RNCKNITASEFSCAAAHSCQPLSDKRCRTRRDRGSTGPCRHADDREALRAPCAELRRRHNPRAFPNARYRWRGSRRAAAAAEIVCPGSQPAGHRILAPSLGRAPGPLSMTVTRRRYLGKLATPIIWHAGPTFEGFVSQERVREFWKKHDLHQREEEASV